MYFTVLFPQQEEGNCLTTSICFC